MKLRTHASIFEIGKGSWNALLREGDPPFLGFDWLSLLEKNGLVDPERGWLPRHLALWEGEQLVAAAPAYLKGNSEGEFVFDYGWAEYATVQLGIDYYPKLIVAVPFTPASGPRFLVHPNYDATEVLGTMARALPDLIDEFHCSSAHVLFPDAGQAEALEQLGLLHRVGLQFHWTNRGYQSFDDFLARFNAKHRHQIKRERRQVAEAGIEVRVHTGSEITEQVVDSMFDFYRATVQKHYWGRQYLDRGFFHDVCRAMPSQLHIVMAWQRGVPIAGAFNLLGEKALYGRYWGTLGEYPFLHFEVCFYRGIEDCIARGLSRFEPGAGGEHKVARGFEPTATHSAHLVKDPVLRRVVTAFVHRERERLVAHIDEACASSILKK